MHPAPTSSGAQYQREEEAKVVDAASMYMSLACVRSRGNIRTFEGTRSEYNEVGTTSLHSKDHIFFISPPYPWLEMNGIPQNRGNVSDEVVVAILASTSTICRLVQTSYHTRGNDGSTRGFQLPTTPMDLCRYYFEKAEAAPVRQMIGRHPSANLQALSTFLACTLVGRPHSVAPSPAYTPWTKSNTALGDEGFVRKCRWTTSGRWRDDKVWRAWKKENSWRMPSSYRVPATIQKVQNWSWYRMDVVEEKEAWRGNAQNVPRLTS
ncbi:hypothetical protein IW262DRAFT_1291286 [Armillaria fumosa]|nr:hypothetical protein IW262DRAFT_1291286 [Armillaria fumosa]